MALPEKRFRSFRMKSVDPKTNMASVQVALSGQIYRSLMNTVAPATSGNELPFDDVKF